MRSSGIDFNHVTSAEHTSLFRDCLLIHNGCSLFGKCIYSRFAWYLCYHQALSKASWKLRSDFVWHYCSFWHPCASPNHVLHGLTQGVCVCVCIELNSQLFYCQVLCLFNLKVSIQHVNKVPAATDSVLLFLSCFTSVAKFWELSINSLVFQKSWLEGSGFPVNSPLILRRPGNLLKVPGILQPYL